jgi:hypothetical protein
MDAWLSIALGYAISWGYFFLTLRAVQAVVGKGAGLFLNYAFSYVIWVALSYVLAGRQFNRLTF